MFAHVIAQGIQKRCIAEGNGQFQVGEQAQCRAQLGEISRPRRLQSHSRQNAFEIADLAQLTGQCVCAGVAQDFQCAITGIQHGMIAQWPVQPAPQ